MLEFRTHPLSPYEPSRPRLECPRPLPDRWHAIQAELARHLVEPALGARRYVEALLDEAVRVRATDVHLVGAGLDDPLRSRVRIEFRIDGVLHRAADLYATDARRVLSHVKVLAGMDLGRPRFQEARLHYQPHNPNLEIRATAAPAADGEHIALRLFSRDLLLRSLDEIGLGEDLDRLHAVLDGDLGLVLVTGPAGAGKSTTIHAILRDARFAGRNTIAIEDPMEAKMEHATQIEVRRGDGPSFAEALMSALRMDPDAIVLGEMRDAEAARAAVYAATTGKFVFSTLHTREAADAVDALTMKGVARYDAAATLRAVLSQRLVRKICPCCSSPYEPDEAVARLFAERSLPLPHGVLSRGRGCGACYGTGYLGRTGAFELLVMDDDVARAIRCGADADEIRALGVSGGMTALFGAGLRLAAAGVTTLDEVLSMHASRSDP